MSPTTPPPPGTGDVVAGAGPIGRRRFLALLGAAGAAVAVGGRLRPAGAQTPPVPNGYVVAWPDGVIAGDPTPDGTVLWTRVEPPAGAEPVPVTWEVAADDAFTSIVAGGVAVAESSADWTVKVPVTGLAADGWLHYRFLVGADAGPVGRLRTAPPAGTPTASLRFGFASCQQRGTERVAQRAASEEAGLDFFVHLGDYVYVDDGATVSLDDYRGVYHAFKGDARLQQLQATLPLVAMWDDGEFRNGIDRTEDPARRLAAETAWFENMPVEAPGGDVGRPYRTVAWGDLADLFLIETRSRRDPELDDDAAGASTAGRTCLGAEQKAWLLDGLRSSTARWKLIASPTDIAPWANLDPSKRGFGGWDDYAAERDEILGVIAAEGIEDVVFLCGETHVFIAAHLMPSDDPGGPAVAFAFTTGSQSADPDLVRSAGGDAYAATQGFVNVGFGSTLLNPHQTYVNLVNFGYTVVQVDECAVTVEFRTVNVYDPDSRAQTLARFRVAHGATRMESEIADIPALSAPDPSRTIPSPFASTGLSAVPAAVGGVCPLPAAPSAPQPVAPAFTG
ncbi:MAG: alkaline phosphatase D family protein [Microthrixaceae bacterium]|nr:alkaline phosphatase D family protein [Microthrixaceae bacterium]